ncbi:MAG: hypothetical protein Q9219_006114 [cf. Caloplaca sp. 3 TL-2023]
MSHSSAPVHDYSLAQSHFHDLHLATMEETSDTARVKDIRKIFESMASHGNQRRGSQRSKTPDSMLKPAELGIHHNERSSLDTPRIGFPTNQVNVTDIHKDATNQANSVSLLSPSDPPKNSQVAHPISPEHSIPHFQVQAPIASPRPHSSTNLGSTIHMATDRLNAQHQRDQKPRLSPHAGAPIPNRATKPVMNPQPACRSNLYTSMSESKGSFQAPGSPQRALEADSPVIKGQMLSYGTPQQRHNGRLNADVTDKKTSVNVQRRPKPREDVGIPPSMETVALEGQGTIRLRGQPESKHSPAVPLALSRQPDAAFGSLPEGRPALPPRPDSASFPPAVGVQYQSAVTPSAATPVTPSLGEDRARVTRQTLPARDMQRQNLQPPSLRTIPHAPSVGPSRSPFKKSSSSLSTSDQFLRPSVSKVDIVPTKNHPGVAGAGYNSEIKTPTVECPDGSSSNRRPPWTRTGSQVINTSYDTRILDMCAGKACCAGQLTRVWDLLTGTMILSLALGEKDLRATAVAFKPALTPNKEGLCIWAGTNYGDLHEIDIVKHKIVSSRLSIHGGREVVKIHRYQNAMWTLDEDGSLYVWSPDESGLPTLESRSMTRRVPRGYTFSIVVGGVLWAAFGKDLQVFRPCADALEEFKPLQQPSSLPNMGEITSGAVVGEQLDKVYFSHSDGKISTYSIADYTCLELITVSSYKINCLVGAGTHLWTGYNTGKICVYNPQSKPWKVIKEWHAHEGPVSNLAVDQTSLWRSGFLHLGSLSMDNTLKLWDGLLEKDWLGTSVACETSKIVSLTDCSEFNMQDNDASWCNFREIDAVVVTWNAGASTPTSLFYEGNESNLLRLILPSVKTPDLLIFGFQELIDLEDKRLTASPWSLPLPAM